MGNASSTQLGSKSTAEDVAAAFPGAVRGKTALVTGGYSGLGLETARVLALNGATVVIAGRSQQAGDEAVQKLKALAPAADVSFLKVDLADIKQTTAAAAAYAKSGKPLHLLLNNAGVMACPKGLTKDGIETQMGTNHIGEQARGWRCGTCHAAALLLILRTHTTHRHRHRRAPNTPSDTRPQATLRSRASCCRCSRRPRRRAW